MGWRRPMVPPPFWHGLEALTRADMTELVWDLMIQSPWFDESTAVANIPALLSRIQEICAAYREARAPQQIEG